MTVIMRVSTVFTGLAGTPLLSQQYFTRVVGSEQALVNAVDQFWTDMAVNIDNGLSWTVSGSVEQVEDTTGDIVGVTTVTAGTGAGIGTGNAMPPATQGLINLRTGAFLGGRELRGKIYVPGPVVSSGDVNGRATTAYTSDLQTAINDLIVATSGPGPLRVFSRKYLTSRVVSSGGVKPDFAVLRSRRD